MLIDGSVRVSRRERDVAEFLERRMELITGARREAGERIERLGEDAALRDALGALAHSGAAPCKTPRAAGRGDRRGPDPRGRSRGEAGVPRGGE
jgi:hypothetical protein